MVKIFSCCLAFAFHLAAFAALHPPLEEMGEPFDGKNVEIIWKAATNQLPATLNIYQILPKIFPEKVISNLVAVAEFKEPEKVRAVFKPTLQGKRATYQEAGTKKYLSISPENGHIVYQNFRVIALPREPNDGVPEKEKVLELAIKLLPMLAIKESELARKPNSNQLQLAHVLREQGWFDRQSQKKVKRTVMQGVVIGRGVDDVAFNGRGDCGGVRVSYGNHLQIAELQVVCPNLKASKKVPVASAQQIILWIKQGQAVIEVDGSVYASQIKKLTITQITPYYLGKDVTEAQRTVYPYAMLTAEADTGVTNAIVWLSCPIFK